MRGAAPRARTAWRIGAALAFVAMLACGPLTEHARAEQVFSATLVGLVLLAAAFASARAAFALCLATLLFGLLEAAARLKFLYLDTPLLAPDLEYFVTLQTLELFSHYPLLLGSGVAALVLLPGPLALSWRAETPALANRRPRAEALALRLLGSAASLALLLACASPAGPFGTLFDKPMWAAINDRSFITNFVISFNDTEVERPTIPPDVDRTIAWTRPPQAMPAPRPDIVAVLEESTFDPAILAPCTLPACRLAMFRPDARTDAHGPLKVHTFGGGTWTAEFSFLTGIAHTLFGNAGLYAPYNLAPRVAHTLPRALRAAGYRSIAIYPMSGDFLNARNAYEHYGFDAFHDGTEWGLDWDSHDTDLLAVFERIYAAEKQAHPDTPLFVFMLTLHQHGPHMTPLAELPPPFDKPLFPGRFKPPALDNWLNLNLGNYLQRAHESDVMLARLRERLLARPQPTVLLHFGDHQPSFDGAFGAIPKRLPKGLGPAARWLTYYMIRSNLHAPGRFDYPALDIAFLGGLLLDVARVPADRFFQANALLRERCHGRYLDCKDQSRVTSYHAYVFDTLTDLAE